ncbi:hypothetical protein QCI77_28370 [Bacillus cereus group sp. MG9]|uniref:hypothetical protein n=1 Tax=Bacillus cereus group sp. MG9 TaxID=3040247 RepID=UPI00339ABD30
MDLIEENVHREVTFDTNHKVSGIYMLYVDHFKSDTIIPFYIGQSGNIQKRYGDHVKEVMALNRISNEEYMTYFFAYESPYFNGKYKACKIFKYMIENQCTLKDLRMVILEEVEKTELKEREQTYFEKLSPAFLGFNQMNTIHEANLLKLAREINDEIISKFLHVFQMDLDHLFQYNKFGYTQFNYENCFPKGLSFIEKRIDILQERTVLQYEKANSDLEKVKILFPYEEPSCDIEKSQAFIDATEEAFQCSEATYQDAVLTLEASLIEKFEELEIYKTITPINNFIKSIANNEEPKFKNYFLRYTKSVECESDFYEMFADQIAIVEDALIHRSTKEEQVQAARGTYDDCILENRKHEYRLIFPPAPYPRFPLQDQRERMKREKQKEQGINTCDVSFYISNDGVQRNWEIEKLPDILKICYSFTDHIGERIENEYYIENTFTTGCQSGIRYILEGFHNPFQENGYKLSGIINGYYNNSFISLVAEFKHGMNDYTIQNQSLVPLVDVFEEIHQLTDEHTVFRIFSTESLNCLLLCMSANEQKHPIAEKLLKMKVKRIKR